MGYSPPPRTSWDTPATPKASWEVLPKDIMDHGA